jgi:hypothetical protein
MQAGSVITTVTRTDIVMTVPLQVVRVIVWSVRRCFLTADLWVESRATSCENHRGPWHWSRLRLTPEGHDSNAGHMSPPPVVSVCVCVWSIPDQESHYHILGLYVCDAIPVLTRHLSGCRKLN